jgi:cytochrome c oxidase subunit IV
MSQQHISSLRANFAVFAALLALLGATVGLAYVDLGKWNLFVALAIAAVKAALIVLIFMHVRYSHRLVWVFSSAGLLWLTILLVLTLVDYGSRGWLGIEGK